MAVTIGEVGEGWIGDCSSLPAALDRSGMDPRIESEDDDRHMGCGLFFNARAVATVSLGFKIDRSHENFVILGLDPRIHASPSKRLGEASMHADSANERRYGADP
ncbi:hypothetical protein [Notoacmeibacter marinus]|uniref:hypothetical protein n=1 Tax=Notoacmeibacter marinus TaxID=1876515 RepID=UPI000DF365DB|nr:hypothetical protein [Notoacmeibacter marinus]